MADRPFRPDSSATPAPLSREARKGTDRTLAEALDAAGSAGAPTLVLASASPARLTLLRDAGVDPAVVVSEVDEEALVAARGATGGREVSLLLAEAKATTVAGALPPEDAAPRFVLGCDSVLEVDGVTYGKPHTPERAREQWRLMRGRRGVLYTGHWLVRTADGATAGEVSAAAIHLAEIGDDELEAYLATGEPLEVAGALTIDGYGGAYVTRIEGDHHGVIGLSVPLLRTLTGRLGVPWHRFWNRL